MIRFPRSLSVLQLLVAPFAAAQERCPEPAARRIAVAPGVSIHVREWGGSGQTVFFLSGFAATAFAFDDFAPLLTNRFRVVGITKRGIPPSDTSSTDYSAATLTRDVLAVMDSLNIREAHLVGWSYGGNEAVRLAVANPTRVLSVVLLDSYDNSREADTFKELAGIKSALIHEVAADSASVHARMSLTRRLGFRSLPLTHICAFNRFAPDGRYVGPIASPRVRAAIGAGAERLAYSKVTAPVLAFFKLLRSVEDMYPDYPIMSSTDRTVAESEFPPTVRAYAAARTRLKQELPSATVIEIAGAAHHLFASDPEIVFREMLSFWDRIAKVR
jgi:pimeloyl-ACP methyl ester carboxylesterase